MRRLTVDPNIARCSVKTAPQHLCGARNLLEGAMRLSSDDSLLILAEKAEFGLYDREAVAAIQHLAREIARSTTLVEVDATETIIELPEAAAHAFASSDKILFQGRLGDAARFDALRANTTMSYAYNVALLGSPFCTTPHELMRELAAELRAEIASSRQWRLSTRDGTLLEGRTDKIVDNGKFQVQRFPVCTIPPIGCSEASGQIKICPWVTSTAHYAYPRESLTLSGSVLVSVEAGQIVDFVGARGDVEKLHQHYDYVSRLFDIDPFVIDSWHCGLHPQCQYDASPEVDIAMWSRSVFANPRYLHLHTCGAYPPGEICLSALDVTIDFDGKVFWENGELVFYRRPHIIDMISAYGLQVDTFVKNAPIGIP